MRKAKIEQGKIYHVYNRGVEKRDIFLSDGDRWRFLQGMYLFNDQDIATNILYRLEQEKGKMHFGILRQFTAQQSGKREPLVRIMADCLKENHFHMILQEFQEGGISKFMQKLGIGYTGYFNKKYERVGPLFQGAFKAVEIKNHDQLQYLTTYVNVINPGQELEPDLKSIAHDPIEVLRFAEHYSWSTHLEYLGKRNSIITDKGIAGELFATPAMYKKFVSNIIHGKQKLVLNEKYFLD